MATYNSVISEETDRQKDNVGSMSYWPAAQHQMRNKSKISNLKSSALSKSQDESKKYQTSQINEWLPFEKLDYESSNTSQCVSKYGCYWSDVVQIGLENNIQSPTSKHTSSGNGLPNKDKRKKEGRIRLDDKAQFPQLPARKANISNPKKQASTHTNRAPVISLRISDKPYQKKPQGLLKLNPTPVIKASDLSAILPKTWKPVNHQHFFKCHKYPVLPNSEEYKKIALVLAKTGPTLILKKIERLENVALKLKYDLKKVDFITQYKGREIDLYHGTSYENLESILSCNLNWRLHGTNVGYKFGKGVSFSTSASYSFGFCPKESSQYILLICKVLCSKSYPGNYSTELPKQGCDATCGKNGRVIVKYYDHEFYPEYILYVDEG